MVKGFDAGLCQLQEAVLLTGVQRALDELQRGRHKQTSLGEDMKGTTLDVHNRSRYKVKEQCTRRPYTLTSCSYSILLLDQKPELAKARQCASVT